MARDFHINGETLVRVRGGAHLTSGLVGNAYAIATVAELGLTSEAIQITPRFFHKDINVDDFGPNIPPEVMYNLADVTIRMTLVHYDKWILTTCVAESMGGASTIQRSGGEGIVRAAGSLMGNNQTHFASGWHYISLNLASPVEEFPWRFPSCYLSEPPINIPLSTEKSAVALTWRAIPYTNQTPTTVVDHYFDDRDIIQGSEITSSGAVLWDHQQDGTPFQTIISDPLSTIN